MTERIAQHARHLDESGPGQTTSICSANHSHLRSISSSLQVSLAEQSIELELRVVSQRLALCLPRVIAERGIQGLGDQGKVADTVDSPFPSLRRP